MKSPNKHIREKINARTGEEAPSNNEVQSMHATLWNKYRAETGSAIVEFVVLAIPLFIPIFMYVNHFASVSGNEEIARVMAREGLRAYVASDSDHAGRVVSAQALSIIATQLGLSNEEIKSLNTHYECSNQPCLSADGQIRLTVTFIDRESHRIVEASAQEYVSPWM